MSVGQMNQPYRRHIKCIHRKSKSRLRIPFRARPTWRALLHLAHRPCRAGHIKIAHLQKPPLQKRPHAKHLRKIHLPKPHQPGVEHAEKLQKVWASYTGLHRCMQTKMRIIALQTPRQKIQVMGPCRMLAPALPKPNQPGGRQSNRQGRHVPKPQQLSRGYETQM